MMSNLFISFNPSSSYINLNWMCFTLIYLLLPLNLFIKMNRTQSMLFLLQMYMSKETKPITKDMDTKGASILFPAMFTAIVTMNMASLIPFTFTPTSHMSVTLTLSITFWTAMFMYSWWNNSNFMFSHLTPQSTPKLLIPLMVMIESISIIIRPITLAVRLMANIIAGHLLLILLSNPIQSIPMKFVPLVMIPHIMLMTLELAVAMIQAYVFSILLTLYYSDMC